MFQKSSTLKCSPLLEAVCQLRAFVDYKFRAYRELSRIIFALHSTAILWPLGYFCTILIKNAAILALIETVTVVQGRFFQPQWHSLYIILYYIILSALTIAQEIL